MSRVAARSATLSGALIRKGESTPAWPTRSRSVVMAMAVSTTSGAEE